MAREEIGNPLDRQNRNNHNDNYKELYGEVGKVNNRVDNIIDEVSDEAFGKVVENSKLNWKEPVDNFNSLPSNAQNGDTRMDRSTGKVYRYDGANWVEIQQIDVGPVNELDSRLTSQLNETGQHLDDKKMDKNTTDISVHQINKNKGLLDETYFTDEVKQQWTGNTPIHTTPADRSVTTIKVAEKAITPIETNFAKMGKNKFDGDYINRVLPGDETNGFTVSVNEGGLTAVIKVEGNTTYAISKSADTDRFRLATFNAYPKPGDVAIQSYGKGSEDGSEYKTISINNEKYLAIFVSSAAESKKPSRLQVEVGNAPTEYEEPKVILNLDEESINVNSIKPEKTTFAKPIENLWNGKYDRGVALTGPQDGLVYSTSRPNAVSVEMWVNEGTYTISRTEDTDHFSAALFNEKPTHLDPVDDLIYYSLDGKGEHVTFTTDKRMYLVVYLSTNDEGKEPSHFQIEHGDKPNPLNSINVNLSNRVINDIKQRLNITSDGSNVFSLNVPSYQVSNDFIDNTEMDTLSKYYSKFDDLIEGSNGYISKRVVTDDTTGAEILVFDFNMPENKQVNITPKIKKPKILIIGGTHGHETSVRRGIVRFFNDLRFNWKSNPSLEAIKKYLHITFVPAATPYGVENNQRINENGVDINRNFPTDFVQSGEGTNYYSGVSPLSEKESKLIDRFLKDEKDVFLAIDYHNQGSYVSGDTMGYLAVRDNNKIFSYYNYANNIDMSLRKKFEGLESSPVHLFDANGRSDKFDGALYKHFEVYGIDGLLLEITSWYNNAEDTQEINAMALGQILVDVCNYNYEL